MAEAGKRKKEIIRKHEEGMQLTDFAKEKENWERCSQGVTRVSKQQPHVLEEFKKLLLFWIEQKQRAGDTVTEAIICKKAKVLHTDLLNQQPGMSANAEGCKASRRWFERFKTRSGIHSMVRHGEAASSDVDAAEEFATEFLEVMVSEGYLPQQVFNCDETGLFWKRMTKCIFITEEETSLPGHKPMKDRLTLLFCANASGDLKIKPLLVTQLLFVQWVNVVIGPAVKQYLVDNNLPLRELKEACQMWVNLQTFLQQHHPDKALAQRLVNSFDTDIMSSFRGMLKRRQRQQTMERFLQKQPRPEEEPACVSAAQLPSSSSSKKC
ncbi:tigger transposable element-derived 1-like [Pelobates cultripes]|uniref:Tigger transposable element-derived 1-like n=1 Tax=Pelobates cultripes TaxID=61616 RepID=A0AAD1RLW9_PELCU|nr:tigger transposable element-derived 1-like [Pelobates cultripes]